MKDMSSSPWGIRPHATSEESRAPSNLTSESLTDSQILRGRLADVERAVAILQRDLEGVESIIESNKDAIKFMERKLKETLNIE